jgi:hypothetical protein
MIDISQGAGLHGAEWHVFENAYLLNHVWEVGEDDARKAARSKMDALERLFLSWSPMKKRGGKISAADMEEWFIDCRRDKPHEAIEYISKTDWVAAARYHNNPLAFYQRLSRQLSRKSSSIGGVFWPWQLKALLAGWDMPLGRSPPYCL